MAKLVFLDTEFTSLLSPELLSVGLVTMSGDELYAELELVNSTFGRERLANTEPNVRYEVIEAQFRLFPQSIRDGESALGRHVADWLVRIAQSDPSGRVELLYDYNIDLELLVDAMSQDDVWSAVSAVSGHRNIAREATELEPRLAAEALFRSLRTREPALANHHALADALALRASWQAWHLARATTVDLLRLQDAFRAGAEGGEHLLFDWMSSPNARFDTRAPLDFVEIAEGVELIERELKRIASGGTP
jgi:hypothetical protein